MSRHRWPYLLRALLAKNFEQVWTCLNLSNFTLYDLSFFPPFLRKKILLRGTRRILNIKRASSWFNLIFFFNVRYFAIHQTCFRENSFFQQRYHYPENIPLRTRLIEFSSAFHRARTRWKERGRNKERKRGRERELSAQFETIRLAIKLGRNFGHYKSGLLTAWR